jgi:large subunit ribosomal protein L10
MERVATKKRLTIETKSKIVENLQKEISSAKCVLFASYEGLTVADVTQIKKSMSKLDSKFNVYRNRLLTMALEKISMSQLSQFVSGPTTVIICKDENKVVDVVKYLCDYAKENQKLKLVGGYLFNTIADVEKLKEISQIPNRETLIIKLLSLLASPINNLYSILNAPMTALLNILEQLRNQKEKN